MPKSDSIIVLKFLNYNLFSILFFGIYYFVNKFFYYKNAKLTIQCLDISKCTLDISLFIMVLRISSKM